MDDAWVIQQQAHTQAFLDHINSIDPAIKFTVEDTQGNGAITFLDTLVTLLADNSLSITVYHKPTHKDQYLQWDGHHSLSAKYSVIDPLTHRAKTICTEPELFRRNYYTLGRLWEGAITPQAINRVQNKVLNNNWEDHSNNSLHSTSSNNNSKVPSTQTGENNRNQTQVNNNQGASQLSTISRPRSTVGQVVIPYTKGIAESFKHICGAYGIKVHFKGNTTIKQVLMQPKDQDPKEKKSSIIYSFQCNHIACDEEYIGETASILGERCKEHLKQPSPIHAHIQQTGHNINDTSFNIIGREDQGQARTIKESIFIRVSNPTLNQNIGKYNLSHIWDRVLLTSQGLNWALPNGQHTNVIWGLNISLTLGS